MELGEPDASGRRRPVEKKGSNFTLDADCVIIAIGNSPNPLIRMTTEGIEANKRGCLVVNEEMCIRDRSIPSRSARYWISTDYMTGIPIDMRMQH